MLEWTGERYIPSTDPAVTGIEIHYEHLHRYAFASYFVRGKDVLDLASGEGYGSYMLAQEARSVTGIDIDANAIQHAETKYSKTNLKFFQGSICDVPLEGRSLFDVIVCFEALEHIAEHEQLLSEITRLLKDDGLVILSTPNKAIYSDEPGYKNPFHVRELDFDEFRRLLKKYFSNIIFFGQKVSTCSRIWNLYAQTVKTVDFTLQRDAQSFSFTDGDPRPVYLLAVASQSNLSDIADMGSYCVDISNSILSQKNMQIESMIKDIDILQNVNLKHQSDISALTSTLQAKDAEIKRMAEKIEELQGLIVDYQARIEDLVEILDSFENSISSQVLKKYDAVLQKVLPSGTRRRVIYERCLEEIRNRISNDRSLTHVVSSPDPSVIVDNRNYSGNIVCFPVIDWDFRYQRPQHLLSRLAQLGYRVFYLTVNLSPAKKAYSIREIQEGIYEVNIPVSKKYNMYNDSLTSEQIDSLVESFTQLRADYGIDRAISFVEFPRWVPIVLKLNDIFGWKIVYDCLDEYSDFSNVDRSILQDEVALVQNSALVVTTSDYLYNKVHQIRQDVVLVPNAGDFEHFSNLSQNELLSHIGRPIIGYYGAISDWFDSDLINYIAKKRPDWTFVFIGHTFGSDIRELDELPNVYFLGEKGYNDLPKYLYWFDVCLIPFKVTKLIVATHPVKFYEYLSAGKPVVSAKLPELAPYSHLCYLFDSKEDAITKIATALSEKDEELKNARIEFARNNTWDKRVEVLLPHIKRVIGDDDA
ncbi:MAG: methyltransferase domain-containing protein [Methanomicrobiales archaeon]|nr:methyltransferase domain-containing protein [Methanomicrobiales archaeon]